MSSMNMYHDEDLTILESESIVSQDTVIPFDVEIYQRLGRQTVSEDDDREERQPLLLARTPTQVQDGEKFKQMCEDRRTQLTESIFERQQLIYNYIENGHVPATDDSDYLQSSASTHHLEHIRQNIDDFYYDNRRLYVTVPGACRIASTIDAVNDTGVRFQIKRTSDYTEISRSGLYNINALYRHHDSKVYHIDICMFENDQANSSYYVRGAFIVTALWLRNTHYYNYYNSMREERYIDGPWQYIDDHSI